MKVLIKLRARPQELDVRRRGQGLAVLKAQE